MAQHAGQLGLAKFPNTGKVLSKTTKTAHLIFYLRNARIDTPNRKENKWLEAKKQLA